MDSRPIQPERSDLPVREVLPEIVRELGENGCAVLQAPPGAGKTTLVPPALLGADWLGKGRVIMLEPRRLAARTAASRIAFLLGDRVGGLVGYRVRMDSRVGRKTRIEVVTEGILTRMIQGDPSLSGVGCLIFDEFHERNLQADLALALALEARSVLRPDLRILVMSATLDGQAVAGLLDDAPIITSQGRQYPVQVAYLNRPSTLRIETEAARAVRQALADHDQGDVLVFLPGMGEIRRTETQLTGLPPNTDVHHLSGSLTGTDQEAVMKPSPAGRRKVVLSTDVAETSVTIQGVRIVIDSGLVRRPLFDGATGMSRLVTLPASQASADQRAGRAGRTAPGFAYRLWTSVDQGARRPHSEPEIAQADLVPLALELAAWGATRADSLRWLDPPAPAGLTQARELLAQLGALEAGGRITPRGSVMAQMGTHPRLAAMLLSAPTKKAALLAALLEDRDVFDGQGRTADVRYRLQATEDFLRKSLRDNYQGMVPNRGRLRDATRRARRLLSLGESGSGSESQPSAETLLATAYPDRIAQAIRADGLQYRLRTGRVAELDPADSLVGEPFLVVAHAGGRGPIARIHLATPIAADELETLFGSATTTTRLAIWDTERQRVTVSIRQELDAIVLSSYEDPEPGPDEVQGVLLAELRRRGLNALPFDRDSQSLLARIRFLARKRDDWPDLTDEFLLATLADWLGPFCLGVRTFADLRKVDLHAALISRLTWSKRQDLDRFAPTHLTVPSGSRVPIDYTDGSGAALRVRLQEMFGLEETPLVDGQPVTIHLLSPAGRPVQITQDLRGFWQSSYFDVRKDMRGRYPKHYWPENPLHATPTARAKPRGK